MENQNLLSLPITTIKACDRLDRMIGGVWFCLFLFDTFDFQTNSQSNYN